MSDTSLLTEVDEMMRQERMQKLWDEYGNWIIGFVVGTILLTAAISGYRAWDGSVRAAQTDQVLTLIDSAQFPDNINPAALNLRPGLEAMAILNAAGAHLNKGETDQAIILYTALKDKADTPPELRGLGVLMLARLNPGAGQLANLKPLLEDRQNPWHAHAHLEAAVIKATIREYAEARDHLSRLKGAQTLPQTLVEKANALDHVYALHQTQQTQEKPGS